MAIQLTVWALLPLFAAGLAAATARYVWEQRREPGGLALFSACAAAAIWAVLQAASLSTSSESAKLFIERLVYLPLSLLPLLWLAFAMGYTGRGEVLRRWPMGVIYAIPLMTIGIVWSGLAHPLLWEATGLGVFRGIYTFSAIYGTWFQVHLGYAYALTFAGTVMLALHIAQSPRHWWRLVWVFGAPAAVITLNALHVGDVIPRAGPSPAPMILPVALLTIAFGLMRRGDADYAPVARAIVVEEMQDCVIVVDRAGRCIDVNRAATDLLRIRPEGEMPIDLSVVWAGTRDSEEEHVHHPEALELRTADGEKRSFDLTVSRLGPQGGRDRSVLVLRDVTETVRMRRELEESQRRLSSMNDRLEHLANTDELTGLPNRRSFFKALERELGRADRYDQPLSVVLLDLDHFKKVNDTWGHPVGDRVLVAAAEAVQGICRDSDVPGRIGGEELAVLLLHTGAVEAKLVAERIRRRIEEVDHLVPGDHLKVTASFGVATSGPGRLEVDPMVAAADEALYKAKHGGRNRIVSAPEATEQTAIDFGR